MLRALLRRFVCVIGLTAFVAASLLPPEHVHAAADHRTGAAELVHRHVAPHHSGHSQTSSADDDDGPVFWLDAPVRMTPRSALHAPLMIVVAYLQASTPPLVSASRPDPLSPPTLCDPPLAVRDFRGPPSSTL